MSYFKKVMATVRATPGKAWVAAVILPGGFIVLSAWIGVSSAYRIFRKKDKGSR